MSASAGRAESSGSTAPRSATEPDAVDADAALRGAAARVLGRAAAVGLPPRARPPRRARASQVNRKRVQRLWREEGLRVPARRRKRQRLGESTVPADRLRAERPDHVWALDFQFDQTADGRVLKLLNVVDEFTREALAMHVARRIDADQAVDVLERLAASARRARARALRQRARADRARAQRLVSLHAAPGRRSSSPAAPWQNAYVESFNGRVRDELLDVEQFSCLAEALVVIEDWRQDYNAHRPALGAGQPGSRRLRPCLATTHRRTGHGNQEYSLKKNIHQLSHAVDQQPGSGRARI